MKVGKLSNQMFLSGAKTAEQGAKQKVATSTYEFPKIDSKYYKANSLAFRGVSNTNEENFLVAFPKVVNGKLIGISCTVFIDENTTHEFEIPKEVCAKYLLGKDGRINSDYLNEYAQTYRGVVQREVNAHKKLIGKNLEILKECVSEVKAQKAGEEFERKILPDIPADKLAKFALTLNQYMAIDETNEQYDEAAMSETNVIFELSKTKDGYDFSNVEQKQRIINNYQNFARNYPDFATRENTGLTISGLVEMSKSKKGKIDLDFIELASRFLKSLEGIPRDFSIKNVAEGAEKIATFCDIKDKGFADYIFKVINNYAFCEYDELDYLKILINPKTGKFDKEYADSIRAKLKEACKCIEDYELDINWEKPNLSWDMVKDYLEYSEDTPNPINFKEYVSQNRYKYSE